PAPAAILPGPYRASEPPCGGPTLPPVTPLAAVPCSQLSARIPCFQRALWHIHGEAVAGGIYEDVWRSQFVSARRDSLGPGWFGPGRPELAQSQQLGPGDRSGFYRPQPEPGRWHGRVAIRV